MATRVEPTSKEPIRSLFCDQHSLEAWFTDVMALQQQ